jgi:hypothetical protein
MKEQFEKAKKFVVDHKYEFTVGAIVVGAVTALAVVKCMGEPDELIDATEPEAIEDSSDDVDSTSVEE